MKLKSLYKEIRYFFKSSYKVIFATLALLFGILCIIYPLLFDAYEVDVITVQGKFQSYHIERGVGYKGRSIIHRYISIENWEGDICEYELSGVNADYFKEQLFTDEVNVGDIVILSVTDDKNQKIRAIKTEDKKYLSFENSARSQEEDQLFAYIVGGFFVFVGVAGLLSQIKHIPRKRRIIKRRKKKK